MTVDAAGNLVQREGEMMSGNKASERDRLIKAIHAATFYDEDGPFGAHALNGEAEEMVADAILAAGFGDVAEAKAEALEEAAKVEAERDAAVAIIGQYAGVIFAHLSAPGFEGGMALAEKNLAHYLGAREANE